MSLTNFNHLIPLAQLSAELPHRPHASTLARWATRGIRGIRLETWMLGGRRCTTRDAVDRFIRATSAAGARQKPQRFSAAPSNSSRQVAASVFTSSQNQLTRDRVSRAPAD
jgi:hypothetical protein